MSLLRAHLLSTGRVVGLVLLAVAVSGSAAWLGTSAARQNGTGKPTGPGESAAKNAEAIQRVGPDRLVVPAGVAGRLGLRTATAATPTAPRTLPPFAGTLAVDTNALSRVYSRFPGEVVSLGTVPEPIPTALPGGAAAMGDRPLRVGDRVTKGQTLAVVWSNQLGEKKSELLDALSKLHRDEAQLAALKESAKAGAVPPTSVLNAERDVEASRAAAEKAELTLRSWRLTDAEIAAVRAGAAELGKPGAKRPDPDGWARSPVVSPRDGVIVELNTSASTIVDTTTPLVLVADLSRLAVWAHVYEEDLPLLQSLPTPVKWRVGLAARPGAVFPGTLDSIGAVIDPNQHTALVRGAVANPDGALRAGMFVTVTVDLPPPPGEVEVPAEAVVEDGRESVVFVRSAADPAQLTRHKVKVARRLRDVVYLAAEPGGVRPGDEVVTAGSLLLNEGMNELPAPRP